MTTIAFASLKGAPGVTTLTCLVAAAWPEDRKAVVAECDPSGGDLAARFRLSARCGWTSLAAATRRIEGPLSLAPHLQELPGGFKVLVGPRPITERHSSSTGSSVLCDSVSGPGGPWDLLVDLGRIPPGDPTAIGWLDRSDVVVVLVGDDAASILHLRDRAPDLLACCGERVGAVVVERVGYPGADIQQFTGIPVIGRVPFEPLAAQAIFGQPFSGRRRSRSSLLACGRQLADYLSGDRNPGLSSERTPGVVGRFRSLRTAWPISARASSPASSASRDLPCEPVGDQVLR